MMSATPGKQNEHVGLLTQASSDAVGVVAPPMLDPGAIELPPLEHVMEPMVVQAEETAFVWSITEDSMCWERNATQLLRVEDVSEIGSGRQFLHLLAPEHRARRLRPFSTAHGEDRGNGVPYTVSYRFAPGKGRQRQSLWIEESGRWWAGADGQPARARGVMRIIDDRFVAQQTALYGLDHDEMTGQLSRTRLNEALAATLDRLTEPDNDQSCGFLMISVNNLDVINDTFGFQVGDEVIAAAGRCVRERLRSGDTLGRHSTNKFGVILNDCGAGAMRIAADRLARALRETTIRTSQCAVAIGVSMGGVLLPEQASSVQEVVSRSLEALDQARSRRHDSFAAFEPNPTRERTRRRNLAIADEVVSALDEQRMRLFLQPMVSTKTQRPEIYECLLRMERPDGSIASAGEFIQVAEQLGLSRLIDRRTLELSVDLLRRHPELKLSVNVSGLTCGDHDWLMSLHRLTAASKDITRRLLIEITETAAIEDLDQSVVFVDTLRELGCRVAIDDFGAGYTSFKNLKHLNVDIVKIDGAFVKNLAHDKDDRIFIRTMVQLARNFGMETVAEWVGDEVAARMLTEEGITYLQGFHFGRPIDARTLDVATG